jgi:ABC-2 type transport system ATP-binding protein
MTTVLETRGLTKRFADVTAVDALDLQVRRGEVLGFLGPNGAGKTTSIRMMAGLLRPTSGEVLVEGAQVSPAHPDARRLLGVCPQENVLYPELSARENLEYAASLFGVPRATRRQRAVELLAQLGLAEKEKTRASALSGGMKRRLTIALALVHDPPVLVLDEPEAGLDPQTRVSVREFIRGLKGHKTVVLTSHNMDEVDRIADRVAIVDKGKLQVLGTPEDLKAKHGGGDKLEVALERGEPEVVAKALREGLEGTVHVEGRTILIAGRDLARALPGVLDRARRAGGEIADVRYRATTLEDVFINLTGRGLRE